MIGAGLEGGGSLQPKQLMGEARPTIQPIIPAVTEEEVTQKDSDGEGLSEDDI